MLDEESRVDAVTSRDSESPLPATVSANWNWHRVLLVVLVASFFGYMVAIPLVGNFLDQFQAKPVIATLEEMSFAEAVRIRAMEALTGLWFMALGGTIGSFLNVVVYRMPKGESVIFRASSCPQCGTRILGKDNIPVLGWLNLGGKCRACNCPISPRYPLVEASVAGLFFLLFLIQLITGGENLPVRQPPAYTGIVWIIFYTKWDLILLYLYHCMLISILVVWFLVDFDRQRITSVAKWVAAILLLAPVFVWPFLLPVPLGPTAAFGYQPTWVDSLQVSLVGACVGLALGIILRLVFASGHVVSALALIGVGVGWQAVIAVTMVALLTRLVISSFLRLFSSLQLSMTAFLFSGFCLHHLGWRWLITNLSPWWPGPDTAGWGWLATAAAFVLLLGINANLFQDPARDDAEIYSDAGLLASSRKENENSPGEVPLK
jgi:leader peptidase (prepilin peptidase)/N-methyltransferase